MGMGWDGMGCKLGSGNWKHALPFLTLATQIWGEVTGGTDWAVGCWGWRGHWLWACSSCSSRSGLVSSVA
jgi:hypothetical protein